MRTLYATLFVAITLFGCQGGGGSGEPETAGAPSTASAEPAAPASADAATAAPAAGDGAGPAVSHEHYVIEVEPQGEAAVNQEGRVDIRLVPREGWKVNQEYPTKLTVQAPEGVTLARDEFDRGAAAEFSEPRAVFAVRYTPTEPGERAFTAHFKFSVCNPQTCLLEEQDLRWSVNARPAE